MKTHQSKRSLSILVVFGILIHWCCFSQESVAAEAQKPPGATQPKNPSVTRLPLEMKVIIEGRAVYGMRGMGRVEMTLTEYHSNGRVGIAGKQTTDDQGYYRFTLDFSDSIDKYKIVPKHPDLSSGDNFSPQAKEFPHTKGTTKIDFAYTGPLPDLVPYIVPFSSDKIKNQGGLASGPCKVKLSYACPNPPTGVI